MKRNSLSSIRKTWKINSITAGGRLAAGRLTHTGQNLSEVPDKQKYPGPPIRRLGMGQNSSPPKNSSRNPRNGQTIAQNRGEAPQKKIPGLRRGVNEIFILLVCFLTGSYRRFGKIYRFSRQGFFIANGTNRLSRNVGNKLPIDAA